MKKQLLSIIKFGKDVCPGCGSFQISESYLCPICSQALHSLICPRSAEDRGVTVRTLFEWRPGQNDLLSGYLGFLKGERRHLAWRYWSQVFLCRQYEIFDRLPKIDAVVPAPGKEGRPDHAYLWGEALSIETGAVFYANAMAKVGHGEQKDRTRKERYRGTKYVKLSELAELHSKRIVLADDIVTTGSTMMAMKHALCINAKYELWALARRTAVLAD